MLVTKQTVRGGNRLVDKEYQQYRRRGSASVLRTTADLNETPYCRIASESVLVGRKFDIKR